MGLHVVYAAEGQYQFAVTVSATEAENRTTPARRSSEENANRKHLLEMRPVGMLRYDLNLSPSLLNMVSRYRRMHDVTECVPHRTMKVV